MPEAIEEAYSALRERFIENLRPVLGTARRWRHLRRCQNSK